MTLIITRISEFGITMAADSAVTVHKPLPDGKMLTRVLTGIKKLQPIYKLEAGISGWGIGNIHGIDADVWINRLIRTKADEYDSLNTLAIMLQDELRKAPEIQPIDVKKYPLGTIGYHLAGYVDFEGEKIPTFYHIHNGRSQMLEARGMTIDPTLVNANHDLPPQLVRDTLRQQNAKLKYVFIIHNGDYHVYSTAFTLLQSFFKKLTDAAGGEEVIPAFTSLGDMEDWSRFEIETIANIYKFRSIRFPDMQEYIRYPTIGGDITTLSISQRGIESYQMR